MQYLRQYLQKITVLYRLHGDWDLEYLEFHLGIRSSGGLVYLIC